MEKFAPKYLIWQAICSCGPCCPPFVTWQTLTADIYTKEYLKKRLLPFINKSQYFWPDLASIHYSKKTIEWYEQNVNFEKSMKKVNFVPKLANPANRPEEHPIKSYGLIVKGRLRKNRKQVVSLKDMKKKWVSALKEISKILL